MPQFSGPDFSETNKTKQYKDFFSITKNKCVIPLAKEQNIVWVR